MRGDYLRIEEAVVTGSVLGGDLTFVHSFVREHRLPDEITDGEYMRHVCAHLLVYGDETSFVDLNAGVLGADGLAVRPAAHSYKNLVEGIAGGGAAAFERHFQTLALRLDLGHLRLEVDCLILPR